MGCWAGARRQQAQGKDVHQAHVPCPHRTSVREAPEAVRPQRSDVTRTAGRRRDRTSRSSRHPPLRRSPASSRLSDCPTRSRAWAPDAGARGAGRSLVSRDVRPAGAADHPGVPVDAARVDVSSRVSCRDGMASRVPRVRALAVPGANRKAGDCHDAPAARWRPLRNPHQRSATSCRPGDTVARGESLPHVPAGSILRACRRREPLMAGRGAIPSGWPHTTFTGAGVSTGV